MREKHDCYEILLNYNCNARCSFCSQGSFDKSLNASFSRIAKEVYWGRKSGYRRLGLSGGEPLLRPDLGKVITLARAVGFRFIRIQTNGMLLADAARCKALADAGLTFCKFTFTSHLPAVHDVLMGRPGAWRKALTGLKNLRGLHVGLGVNVLLNRKNYRQLDKTIRFFLDQKVSNFVVIFPLYEGSMWKNARSIGVSLPQAAPFILNALALMERAGLPHEMKILNVPPCFLPGHERKAMDLYKFNTIVTEPSGKKWDLDDESHGNKVQGPPCRACALGSQCKGVDANYIDIWGWTGFRPIRKVKDRPEPERSLPRRAAPIPYLTDNEKCLLEILKDGSALETRLVLAKAPSIPLCQDCRDGNAVIHAAQRLMAAGLVTKQFVRGKYLWSLVHGNDPAPSHL